MLDVLDDGASDGGARPSITPRLTLAVVAIAPALCLPALNRRRAKLAGMRVRQTRRRDVVLMTLQHAAAA
jgi:hypothetical protein